MWCVKLATCHSGSAAFVRVLMRLSFRVTFLVEVSHARDLAEERVQFHTFFLFFFLFLQENLERILAFFLPQTPLQPLSFWSLAIPIPPS